MKVARKISIEDVSGWVLRLGVSVSILVMLSGMALSFAHHNVGMERMRSATFEYHPRVIWEGLRDLRGQAVIEMGIYLLLATPILRVAASMVLFLFSEHDWLYAAITLGVLALTLTGLLLLT